MSRVATRPGKTKKNVKSQVKMGVFEKSQERSGNKNQKTSDFVSSNLPNKILIFKSLQVVKKLFKIL